MAFDRIGLDFVYEQGNRWMDGPRVGQDSSTRYVCFRTIQNKNQRNIVIIIQAIGVVAVVG